MNCAYTPYKIQLFFLLFLIGLAHFFVDTMLGIWPIYKSIFQFNTAKAGLIVAAGAFIGEGSQLLFGLLSDMGYRKYLIVIGLILTTAGSILIYSPHDIISFILYLMICIGSGCFHPCAASLVNSLIPSRRALLMAIFATGGSLGLATSQLTFMYIYAQFEGQTYVLAWPAVGLAILLICWSFPQADQIQKEAEHHRPSLKDFAEFFKNRSLRALYFSQVANQSILWGTIFILPDMLNFLGYSHWICYGGGHFCFILGAACVMVPGGYLADIYSIRQIMLYGGWISFLAFYFILFSREIPISVVLLALFTLGATLALMNPLAVSMGVKLEPNRSGAISAFLMGLVWCLSEALGPGGVGLMTTLLENPVKSLAILGSLFLIQIYATACLPKRISTVEAVT